MAQWLIVHSALTEDPCTHIGQLTTICNPSSKGIQHPLLDSVVPALTCIAPYSTHMHIIS